jgi:uncharacterized membrane protein
MHFLNPNYHVILIHYPLGVFILGTAIELLGFLWKESSVRVAARWMILIGGLAALPAATSGIYALSDAVSSASGITAAQAHMLRFHTWLQSIATLVASLTAVYLIAASDGWRRRFHWIALSLLVACCMAMVAGSWFGGETVYTQGTAVDTRIHTPRPKLSLDQITYFTGEPVQIHMIIAGLTFALAFAALGLSILKITAEYPDAAHLSLTTEPPSVDSAVSAGASSFENNYSMRSPAPILAPTEAEPSCIPAGCFWLMGALFALLTIVGGYWVWANDASDASKPTIASFWNEIMMRHGSAAFTRQSVHVWVGVSLLVLPLLLAALSRLAPQQKTMLAIFGLLLVLAMAAQVWLGVLLTFDGADPKAPLLRFTPPDKDSASLVSPQDGSTFSTSSV